METSAHVSQGLFEKGPENRQLFLLNLSKNKLSFSNYDKEKYLTQVKEFGLEDTWAHILNNVELHGTSDFLNPNKFGALYEAGLAEENKQHKKTSGQYFTPADVSKLMATWLLDLRGVNVCDIGCGTGNLIMAYLDLIGEKEAISLLESKRIFLYDFDKIALTIAKYSIASKYGFKYLNNINAIYGDFLSKDITIPYDSKIITNPPYAKYSEVNKTWAKTKIEYESKELYAAFMEKIILSNNPAVIISPYSFLGGIKFQSLRNLLSEHNGFIVSFDNVPGNIFRGKKQGIFNTNNANSVRAAITVIENTGTDKGFRLSHLIRFKAEEREKILDPKLLKDFLCSKPQVTNSKNKMFARCHKGLENCLEIWRAKSTKTMKDLISTTPEKFTIYMPNTCRYYTTASEHKLIRGGLITINVKDKNVFNYLYCLINSSFVYWWWRVYDGGITYPKSLLNSIPVFYDLLNSDDKVFFENVADEMINKEKFYVVRKVNAGTPQENIRFPKEFRDKINKRILKILGIDLDYSKFDLVHNNSVFDK